MFPIGSSAGPDQFTDNYTTTQVSPLRSLARMEGHNFTITSGLPTIRELSHGGSNRNDEYSPF